MREVLPPPPQPPAQASRLQAEQPSAAQEWDDERAAKAARDLAARSPLIKAGKICYSFKNDEWWVVLYEDVGGSYELKQFVWNKAQDRLEPFLVHKTVAKTHLRDHLTQSEGDRDCKQLELGPSEQ